MSEAKPDDAPAEPRCVLLPSPQPGSLIQANDLVVVYESYSSMKYVYVDPSRQFQNKFGAFAMSAWVGLPFGTKVHSTNAKVGKGWVYLLRPTPELWTQTLSHRTQILYAADIALVCAWLELSPGAVVLESGTGSGSLTTSLARAVAPTGRVYTYEFHEERAKKAEAEFARHGLSGVEVACRDIEGLGFPDAHAGGADAVFLDLPRPYVVVKSAAACLRRDGVFCSFSPCIEQVQRTCLELANEGFGEIRTFEILLRIYDVWRERPVEDLDKWVEDLNASYEREFEKRRAKRARTEDGGGAAEGASQGAGAAEPGPTATEVVPERVVRTKPQNGARGHTGYLTFARKLVCFVDEEKETPAPAGDGAEQDGGE
ncbi:unnamed protein product [Pedinophyceae sp. YPF-701]|nr:unnamed protein product [Pedinophyceae sp. YPF-701]